MNEMQFDYIVNNGLYNAANQVTYTRNNNIALPVGAIELKAAWKILTPAQAASGRFHTAKAYLLGPPLRQVTVGLVALHVFTGGGPRRPAHPQWNVRRAPRPSGREAPRRHVGIG